MGWNKQSGDAWVLQRTAAIDTKANQPVKMLQLRVLSLLTTEDAEKLAMALEREVEAARRSEDGRCTNHRWDDTTHRCLICGVERQISYGSSVSPNWDEVLGIALYPWQRDLIDGIMKQKQPPANLEDDDGCPND